jgi:hypothetical protein
VDKALQEQHLQVCMYYHKYLNITLCMTPFYKYQCHLVLINVTVRYIERGARTNISVSNIPCCTQICGRIWVPSDMCISRVCLIPLQMTMFVSCLSGPNIGLSLAKMFVINRATILTVCVHVDYLHLTPQLLKPSTNLFGIASLLE